MDYVLNLLKECRVKGTILTKEQILSLTEYLKNFFNIDVEVQFSREIKTHMCYVLETNTIMIDYDRLDSINPIKSNYHIVFSLLHELRHVMQYKYTLNHDDALADYYRACFEYLRNQNIISRIFYRKNHDYFVIEINANIVAAYYLIFICNKLDDPIYEMEYRNRLDMELSIIDNPTSDLVKSCLIGEEEVDDSYQAFFNGLIKNKEERKNQKDLLLM